ncbi:MAG: DUF58 domain-containing protein [Kofleriaceae bacterium]|nr:DUF58 domain-containing protein [Kofleriaceae bacterium]
MRPTPRLLVVFLLGVPVALGAVALDERLWTVWLAYLGATLLLAGLDVALGLPRRRLTAEVELPPQLYIGERGVGTVRLTTRRWRRPTRIGVLAELDPDLAEVDEAEARLEPGDGAAPAAAALAVPLIPRRRGRHHLRVLHLRWRGPFGLIERLRRQPVDAAVAVVPNVGAVRAVALRMAADPHFLAGLKVERFLGDGSEFESLREYVPGLDHRAIDWRASARHRKLLVQEFRAERNHQIVLAVDAGQLMAEPIDGVPKLDHALNAALLLGWIALRTGDRVGLVGFDDRVRTWADPAGGIHAFRRLQAQSAEVDYQAVETNYALSLAELSTRLRRRSLVVVFTDFLDTITAELMIENLTRLARRHLVLFVAVRDPSLEARALARPSSLLVMQQAVVAADFARERAVVLERLRRVGAYCLDASPATFSMALVNRYLDLKRRELF